MKYELTKKELEIYHTRIGRLGEIGAHNSKAIDNYMGCLIAEEIINARESAGPMGKGWKTADHEAPHDAHLIALWISGRVTKSHFVAVPWTDFILWDSDILTHWIEIP